MNKIDKLLNSLTMYRVIIYALMAIVVAAFGLSAIDQLGFKLTSLAGSLALLLALGFITHQIFMRLFRSAASSESWLITVLILFLALKPASTLADYSVLALGIVLAVASKYVFTFGNRHIFNPVAIALLILGLLGSGEVFWWVGSQFLLPVVLIAGIFIVRKMRDFTAVLTFLLVAISVFVVTRGINIETVELVRQMIMSGPIIFFATVMLTEPQTSPTNGKQRLIFAALVGIMFSIPLQIAPIYASPELALVVGNILAFGLNFKRRLKLRLKSSAEAAAGIHEFTFLSDRPFVFKPGQYLEWTLPHKKTDSRGDRRFFTIASSPTESEVKLVIRYDEAHSSSFKRALMAMQPGEAISAAQLTGNFVLPKDKAKKLVFIAGGIGITPFRSMMKYLVDNNDTRSITLYYTSLSAYGFGFWDLFNQAMSVGLRPYYVITGQEIPPGWAGKSGFLTAENIKTEVADYKNNMYYLSGPPMMVGGYKKMLLSAGIPRKNIKTDYFPGF